MSHWQKIRDAAADLRSEVSSANGFEKDLTADARQLLECAAEFLNLDLIPEHPDSNNLLKALAVLEDDCIYYNNHLSEWRKSFCIAHEIGHFRLHHAGIHCTAEAINEAAGDQDSASATEKIIGYGAGERREREANLFALEFLLPCAVLKKVFLSDSQTAAMIAATSGLPVEVVAGQLARAILVPLESEDPNPKKEETAKFDLDQSQRRAAREANCPTLVAAGPGTGKTQTLASRIEFLIQNGVNPKRILALTFSNKAAEEMRERITRFDASAAAQIQVMTFHAYGMDLLRSYYVEAGVEAHSGLLDKIDALLYLETNLGKLKLEHYQNLYDPTANLPALLGAISRAKDELCSPENYRKFGEKMLEAGIAADDEDLIANAEKSLETANVYEVYQEFLNEEKLLDFGDLIFRAVRLLQENPAVRAEVRGKYDAILVDEFQDVNRACGLLLKEVAGKGKTLWAVGDLRQSIYRWRGASPANISLFGEDFPGSETVSLETNYRSYDEIVNLFGKFANSMKAAGAVFFHGWNPNRGPASAQGKIAVHLEIADSLRSEAVRIAENIERYRDLGISYKNCAIICRTHNQLEKYAEILGKKGIPVFYLGEFLEREEVRDLLALLDLSFTAGAHSLVRVARFSEYKIPHADALRLIAAAKEKNVFIRDILADEEILKTLSPSGISGAKKLAKHLGGFQPKTSAWEFLADYLFSGSAYLNKYFASEDVNAKSRRLALYQFLNLAQSAEPRFAGEKEPVREFLNYVKRLAIFNEDRNYAQIPVEAEHLDAVRLLTVHSAKGLEFPVVFIPHLGAGKFPANRRWQTCPNPEGMIAGDRDFHEEEEECLFFVAVSRARDHLHLSRAEQYGLTNSKESKFLTMLDGHLPPPVEVEGVEAEAPPETANGSTARNPSFFFSQINRYIDCPRRFFYSDRLGLKDSEDTSVYQKFHSCVYGTFRDAAKLPKDTPAEKIEQVALEKLNELWLAAEVDSHPYAPIYRIKAEEMVRRMCRISTGSFPDIVNETYEVILSNGRIRIPVDGVEFQESGGGKKAVIRKFKTGKQPKTKPTPDNADVLAICAVAEKFPESAPVLKKIFLGDDSDAEISVTDRVIKNRLAKFETAIDGIGNELFEPIPSEKCPRCPHYFICPSGE